MKEFSKQNIITFYDTPDINLADDKVVRDFYGYECQSMKRYPPDKNNENSKVRNDGSYFVCQDGIFKPKQHDCIVLSFGINIDDRFDEFVTQELKCVVHSFDPFTEPDRVKKLRDSKAALKNAVTLDINSGWKFHSIGITSENRRTKMNKIGWLDTYKNILDYLNLNEKVIDILKIDIEGGEWDTLPDILEKNPDLLCKYVKQIAIETHPLKPESYVEQYKIIKRMEICFRLFKRDHRFYLSGTAESEWQKEHFDFKLQLNLFKDEVDLARFLFLSGELYFVNIKFLSL